LFSTLDGSGSAGSWLAFAEGYGSPVLAMHYFETLRAGGRVKEMRDA
jgi:hypothetical protein